MIPQTGNTAAGSPGVAALPAEASVRIRDQEIRGGSVVVDEVISSGQGWLSIQTQEGSSLGRVIGYVAVNPGPTQNVTVVVDESKATAVLYAILHTDAGQSGVFEYPGRDRPVVVGGRAVAVRFQMGGVVATEDQAAATEVANASGGEAAAPQAGGTPPPQTQPIGITVEDQEPVDGTVKVSVLTSTGPGWLVIYNEDGSRPGEIIGFSAVSGGENRDVVVNIDANKATETLYAVLHLDAGIAGQPEFPLPDKPVSNGTQPVLASFRTNFPASLTEHSASTHPEEAAASTPIPDPYESTPSAGNPSDGSPPTLVFEDQALRGNTVKAVSVYSEGPGFLTIHNQNPAGAYGPVIGWTPVIAGENRDILVKIDITKATEILYGMLHEDNPTAGVLEFPGPDEPVIVQGEIVAQPFRVTAGLLGMDVVIDSSSSDPPYLVDGSGMSLYTFRNDTQGVSNCTGDCQENWFPLLATGRLVRGTGVPETQLGDIELSDGIRQVTYGGLPLYYYGKDLKPGDTLGEGIDELWFLARP
jgi:predicted lipoprotein with Yx(FWY)xxD motif